MTANAPFLASVFEERAENLSKSELIEWTTYTPRDESLIGKLMGPGAKLLTGPRGSGKSTLLKTAFYRLQSGTEVLPVYVNFSRSLSLEPLVHQRADALRLFRQWVLAKIVSALASSFEDGATKAPAWLDLLAKSSRDLIRSHEVGLLDFDKNGAVISPSELLERIEVACAEYEATRCVILMDDAAHAFSLEQQREFFEIFRELRSRRVSCKAAVYPGVTSYSPNFHVGHEAELLEAWSQPDDDEYLQGMRQLVARRLPPNLASQLVDKQEIVDYLALAAFGLPRGFLNMLARVFGVDDTNSTKPTRLRAERAVAAQSEEARGLFRALARKLPRFANFISLGMDLERGMLAQLAKFNGLQSDLRKKAKTVALEHPVPPAVQKILGMLEYAGLLRTAGTVSRGEKGRFSRYAVHYSLVLSEGSLQLGRSSSLSEVVVALRNRHPHAFARTKITSILGSDYQNRCRLELPPCSNCGEPRIAEDQRFCMKCGTELSSVSIYEELLKAPIGELALPSKKTKGILEHTSLRTVQDILLDDQLQQLRSVPRVGPVWSRKIRNAAEEFVGV